eukprot:COSAG03_NODE_6167_length_1103_cov_1.677291_1_plen_28_part_10
MNVWTDVAFDCCFCRVDAPVVAVVDLAL